MGCFHTKKQHKQPASPVTAPPGSFLGRKLFAVHSTDLGQCFSSFRSSESDAWVQWRERFVWCIIGLGGCPVTMYVDIYVYISTNISNIDISCSYLRFAEHDINAFLKSEDFQATYIANHSPWQRRTLIQVTSHQFCLGIHEYSQLSKGSRL